MSHLVTKSKKIINLVAEEEKNEKSDAKTSQIEIEKLNGIDPHSARYNAINKNEWKQCMYCDKFHHKDYYVSGMEYCVHCWAWLNGHEYDIESGVYGGMHLQDDINKVIKRVYPIHHGANCKNDECVFNKIKKYSEIKLLHQSLVELLELNKKPQQVAVSFNYKNKILNVNLDESFIVI
jgi:alkyl hydroperoxide reductase subunit AhpF